MANQLNIAALRLKYATYSEESLDIVRIYQLFAAEHINKVESLRQDDFCLGIDNTDYWIVCRLLQPRLLN